jgi:hypothetical protein
VVQRTSNRVVDDQSFGERTTIVGAVSSNGEPLIPGAREHHVIVAHTPK